MLELTCKRCGAVIREADVQLELALARCAHCGTLFSLKGAQQPVSVQQAVSQARRPLVEMPKGITVQDTEMGLAITYRWFNLTTIGLIVFAVFWNGFMLFWHTMALMTSAYMMSLFGLLHTAVGIFVGYIALAGIFNTTTITADRETLSIRHGPLPWPGNRQVPVHTLTQIYCQENISHTRNGTQYSYELAAILQDAGRQKLVGKFNTPLQALYIEQELERYLGIQDVPVSGELLR